MQPSYSVHSLTGDQLVALLTGDVEDVQKVLNQLLGEDKPATSGAIEPPAPEDPIVTAYVQAKDFLNNFIKSSESYKGSVVSKLQNHPHVLSAVEFFDDAQYQLGDSELVIKSAMLSYLMIGMKMQQILDDAGVQAGF
jgi:hypothetical protein